MLSVWGLGLLSDARGIYGKNFDRLRQLKTRFDPGNIFNKSHAIVPSTTHDFLKTEETGQFKVTMRV